MQVNGQFPYPFLNKLPFPSSFVITAMCAVLLFSGFFQLGSSLNSQLATSGHRALDTVGHAEGQRVCEASGQLSQPSGQARLQPCSTCSPEGSRQTKGKLRRRALQAEAPDAVALIGPKLGSSKN